MTAAYTSAATTQATEAGAITLLKKPFDHDDFLVTLERYCGGELPLPAQPMPIVPANGNG